MLSECDSKSSASDAMIGCCPLCHESACALIHEAIDAVPWKLYDPGCSPRESLRFFQCSKCGLTIKDPRVRANREQERLHYEKHNNDIRDHGYRSHLLKLLGPVLARVSANAVGLDYGCGPRLSIEVLARERGVVCHSYDPHFFPRHETLGQEGFDFITCSEVAEHFTDPRGEFERLRGMLKPGGILGVMTHLVPDDFAGWWYHRDPTHVVFYAESTFSWISKNLGLRLIEGEDEVFLLSRE